MSHNKNSIINDDDESEIVCEIPNECENLIKSNEEKSGESFLENKYFVLGLMGFSLIGQNFVVDNPSALQDIFTEVLHISDSQYSTFYSFYNWPNTILCILNGYIIDKILGCRLSIILFTVLMTIGQAVFATGALYEKVAVMQAGRFIFGFGGESIYVAIFKLAAKWFSGSKQGNMAISFLYGVPNLGSVLNQFVMPLMYYYFNETAFRGLSSNKCLSIALFVSGGVSLFSVFCAIVLAWVDKRKFKDDSKNNDSNSQLRIKDIFKFPFDYWLIVLISFTYFAVMYSFVGTIKLFYMLKYDLSSYWASVCNSAIYILGAILSPFIGIAVDKSGYNLSWLFLGTLLSMLNLCTITYTYINPFINSTVLGILFSLMASAIYPTITFIIPESLLATAYGFLQSLQNLSIACTITAVGILIDTNGYFFLLSAYFAILGLTLVFVTFLFVFNSLRGGNLNKSAKYMVKPESLSIN